MRPLTDSLRGRLVPALLTAAGVTLLAAGLLHYGSPAQAGRPSASSIAARPTPSSIAPGLPSLPPIDRTAPPSAAPSADPNRLATRVVIDALDIDLPIIAQPDPSYPSCNVAMYFQHPELGQPGSGRSIYLYAHARDGMFGPLYERAILGRSGGTKSLIGLLVFVYTSDDFVYEYQITRVFPRVPADSHFLDGPLAAKGETLWLQTSTGPNSTFPKLQVRAAPLLVKMATHADAHPRARPVDCS
jgi:hypothetical protein